MVPKPFQTLPKSFPNPPRSLPKPSPNPAQTLPKASRHHQLASKRARINYGAAIWANLAPTWGPNPPQNGSQDPEKSMWEKALFLELIFWSFGLRFGKVFGRFFAPKMYATSKHAICVKSLQNTAWAHKISSLAFAAHTKMSSQIVEKWYVFGNIDFDSILGWFWKDFWYPKSLIFVFCSNDFSMRILKRVLKSSKNCSKILRPSLTTPVWGPRASLGGGGE